MKRIITLILILGVVLVFFTSCATLRDFVKPQANTLTLHFEDGTELTYLLPPEFPELDENQCEYIPFYFGYAVCIRQEIGENTYGIFVAGEEGEIIGAGMLIGPKEEATWWFYENGKIIGTTQDTEEMNAYLDERIAYILSNPKTST